MLLCLMFIYEFYLPSILIVILKSHNDNAMIFILQNILLGIVTYHIIGPQIVEIAYKSSKS